MDEHIHDEKIEKATDPGTDDSGIDDLNESVGDTRMGMDSSRMFDTGVGEHPGDMGATGDVGLEELATEERLREEEYDMREHMRVPSDMRDPGDPNAVDVGISGGVAAGDVDFDALGKESDEAYPDEGDWVM